MIICTCGHEVETVEEAEELDELNEVALSGYTVDDQRCINFVVLCRRCYVEYKTEGLVLYTSKDQNDWLLGV